MVSARTLCILLFAASFSHAAELTTFDGKKSNGELVSADAKEVIFKSGSAAETFEPSKVSIIDYRPVAEPAQGAAWIEVQLVDGSQFHCSDVQIKGNQVGLTLMVNNPKEIPVKVTVPLTSLFYLIRDFQDVKIANRFREILSKRAKRDVFIFTINDGLDRFDGTFGDADEKGESIQFEGEDGSKNPIAMKRIMGMILNPPRARLPLLFARSSISTRTRSMPKVFRCCPTKKSHWPAPPA